MDHIRQFDWNIYTPDSSHNFVNESDIDGSCIEKILRNKFVDPLAKKPTEDEYKAKINWAEVFTRKNNCNFQNDNRRMLHIPGLRELPQYPKLSALTGEQHRQCLKVLCNYNPDILPTRYIQKPNATDFIAFEAMQEDYEKEQKEFQDWAKSLWCSGHNIRALKPPDHVETVYEAEFNMRKKELECLPKYYEFAAQIPFEVKCKDGVKMVYQEQLINYDMRSLPQLKFPEMITKHLSILKPYPTPKPCQKHPCKFILPNDNKTTELPLTEVDKQLAQYCLDNGCEIIASESALRCLIETDRSWNIPVDVCSVIDADGDKHNVVVLGSDFSINRPFSTYRTYRAYRHLLYNTLVPAEERKRCMNLIKTGAVKNIRKDNAVSAMEHNINSDSSDDEGRQLVIDIDLRIKYEPRHDDSDDDTNMIIDESNDRSVSDAEIPNVATISNVATKTNVATKSNVATKTNVKCEKGVEANETNNKRVTRRSERILKCKSEVTENSASNSECTCRAEDMFEQQFPRSYSKWTIKSKNEQDSLNFVVHYSHKCRGSTGEVIIEPIPEYQLELGASAQSKQKTMSLAMMLYLRRKSSLLNVRVDGQTGEVVCGESVFLEGLLEGSDDVIEIATRRIYTALEQLARLLPGNYVLAHEPQHGLNALLYVARKVGNTKPDSITLEFNLNAADEEKESKFLKTPPILTPTLLPWHKYRSTLPLAFTTLPQQVVKPPTKTTTNKTKTPPKAIKYPKRRSKRKKRRN